MWQRARVAIRTTALGILAAVSCDASVPGGCGGPGCGGCVDPAYRYPVAEPSRPDAIVLDYGARIRVTQAYLDFVRRRVLDGLVATFGAQPGMRLDAEGVLHVDLPDQTLFDVGVPEAELRDAELRLQLRDLASTGTLRFVQSEGVELTIDDLPLAFAGDVRENTAGSTSSCPLRSTLGVAPMTYGALVGVRAVVDPGVGPEPERLADVQVTVDDIVLNSLAVEIDGGYCAEPECQDCALEVGGTCLDPGGRCAECHTFCGALTGGQLSLQAALVDIARPTLDRALKPVIRRYLQALLAPFDGARGAMFETLASQADAFGPPATGLPLGLVARLEPGRVPVLDRGFGDGLELTLATGAEAALADCVDDPGAFIPEQVGPTPVLTGLGAGGAPYHVGVTVAVAALAHGLHVLHRAGWLCFVADAAAIEALTGGPSPLDPSVLVRVAPALAGVAASATGLIVSLGPGPPPTLEWAGDTTLAVDLRDARLALNARIEGRGVRVLELLLDVRVELEVVVLPDNRLELAVGELEVTNVREVFDELIAGTDYTALVPVLADLALRALLRHQLSLPIGDGSDGVSEPVTAVVGPVERDGIQRDHLTLTITFTGTAGASLAPAAETTAQLAPQAGLHAPAAGTVRPTGVVHLAVGAPPPGRVVEHQARVDRGLWHAPVVAGHGGVITVRDPWLRLPGPHTVEVRSRYADDYRTMDPTPAVVEVVADPAPPEAALAAAAEPDAVPTVGPIGCGVAGAPAGGSFGASLLLALALGFLRRPRARRLPA